jgi:DNA-binding MarR family transcriptional regulator
MKLEDAADLAPASADAITVADDFVVLMRSFLRMRAQFLAATEHDAERAVHMSLRCLAHEGPMRSGALAEKLAADPSTVSRQVASLVRDGLVERRADPEDGRASLLVPTEKAEAVLAGYDDMRRRRFQHLLRDWDEADLADFARLLRRFTHDYSTAMHDWTPTRATRPAAAEGNH